MRKLTNNQAKILLGRGFDRKGRECSARVIAEQIGLMNTLALCGGQMSAIMGEPDPDVVGTYIVGLMMFTTPTRAIEVILDFDDTYSVRTLRLVTNGKDKGQVVVVNEISNIYCFQLAETCFAAERSFLEPLKTEGSVSA
jgi:hypothetical protein